MCKKRLFIVFIIELVTWNEQVEQKNCWERKESLFCMKKKEGGVEVVEAHRKHAEYESVSQLMWMRSKETSRSFISFI